MILEQVISILGKNCFETFTPSLILRFEPKLEIYPQQRKIIVNQKEIILSRHEYDIFYFLAQHPGWVFSKEQIFESVWHVDDNSCLSAVINTISRLRKKIEPNPESPIYIQTVPGHGYRFSARPLK